jgi:hypothetical protein
MTTPIGRRLAFAGVDALVATLLSVVAFARWLRPRARIRSLTPLRGRWRSRCLLVSAR